MVDSGVTDAENVEPTGAQITRSIKGDTCTSRGYGEIGYRFEKNIFNTIMGTGTVN